MIEARHLRKTFSSVLAVEDVSFIAEDAKVTGFLGPNGAGKTTTLRMLYGLVKPDKGDIYINQVDMNKNTLQAQSHLGVLPDLHGLYPRLTAREHICYFGRLQGLEETFLQQETEKLLIELDMLKIADRLTQGFSQGERMKVSLARALIHQPKNIILDEPTNGLDVMSTRAFRHLIDLLREKEKCILFSSHVMHEVATLCDAIIIMAKGKVVAKGSHDELLALAKQSTLEEAFVTLTGLES